MFVKIKCITGLSFNSCNMGIMPDMCIPEVQGLGNEGVATYQVCRPQIPMLQLLCNTSLTN